MDQDFTKVIFEGMYPHHKLTIPVHHGYYINYWAKKTFLHCTVFSETLKILHAQ